MAMPQGPSPFDPYAQPVFPYMDDTVNPQAPTAGIPLAAYGQRLLELGQQAGGAAAQGLQQLQQMRPEDVLTPEVLNAEEAQRQLRMERARLSYERNFGSPFQGQDANKSLASQGKQGDIDALLRRVQMARQMGYRPGRGT
jgi:hypothetical protein